MKVSVCVTTFNEELSIKLLLDSLLEQTKKPSEIIIVDAGSTDQTNTLINYYQKKEPCIKLIVEKYASRARGRNIAVEASENEIIAMTDAGCIAEPEWLERITKPLNNTKNDIVAGFYKMTAKTGIQNAYKVFLGVLPEDFDSKFLPSTRSIAFRKSAWGKIGGFAENLEDTAEDTRFNFDAIKMGLTIKRVKKARVHWLMPDTFREGAKKLYSYALGDVKSGIWYHPGKGLTTHNIKAALKIARILFLVMLLLASLGNPLLLLLFIVILLIYSGWSFYKVYIKTDDIEAGIWGVPIQFASDFAVLRAFLVGLLGETLKQ